MPTFEDPNAPEALPVARQRRVLPKNEVVAQFRADLEYWFVRYNNFYSRANAAMRDYRFAHVHLVTSVYNRLVSVFGENIEGVRQSSYELIDLIQERRGQLGEDNACLQEVVEGQAANSIQVGSSIEVCAIYANQTMSRLTTNVFYPAFANIQVQVSTVPVAVIDVLSRGNVLEDETAIIEYLRAQYGVKEFQWLSAVSQLLRWETNRFETDGLFLVDEMSQCMVASILDYLTINARLQAEAQAC